MLRINLLITRLLNLKILCFIHRNTGKVVKSKAIPRKSLNCWVDHNENIYAYYGKKVNLKVVEKHKKSDGSIFYLLEIRTKNTKGEWNIKATIYRHKKNFGY